MKLLLQKLFFSINK